MIAARVPALERERLPPSSDPSPMHGSPASLILPPTLSSETIAEEWAAMTWGNHPDTVEMVRSLMTGSWEAATSYMSPLGLGITVEGGAHYEPRPESRDGRSWFADREGIGYDRTRSGSGYVDQYHAPLSDLWNDPETTPVEEILWFHRLPWEHRLPGGRTV